MTTHSGRPAARFPSAAFTQSKLPAQVFSDASGSFLFFEFARAFGEGAWRLFSRLAREFGEPVVWVRCIDPDANEYYQANFEEAAEFAIAATDDTHAYVDRMQHWPRESQADAMAFRADVVAWTGASGRWACWGEREFGLCVLHFVAENQRLKKELVVLSDDYVPLLALSEALTDIVAHELPPQDLVSFVSDIRGTYR